jgi:hypothetical protein
MKINKDILMYAYPSYDPFATGSKKIFITPQLNYTLNKYLSFFTLVELPVYQYVTKTQVGSQLLATIGFSAVFDTTKKEKSEE